MKNNLEKVENLCEDGHSFLSHDVISVCLRCSCFRDAS